MQQFTPYMPKKLDAILKKSSFCENTIGESESQVFHVSQINGNDTAYLKIHPSDQTESLLHEAEILQWLEDKFAVPRVLFAEKNEYYEFLLLSEINGLPSFAEELREKTDIIIREIARSLRLLHAIPIDDCPFDERLAKKLSVIEKKISANEIDESDFEPEYAHCSIQALYTRLLDVRSDIEEDLVFTHGDFCMPNVLINETKFSGFIDMGRAGISDRYQDIALMLRSLKHNGFNDEHCALFLREYGITQPDYRKIEVYTLIDEFY